MPRVFLAVLLVIAVLAPAGADNRSGAGPIQYLEFEGGYDDMAQNLSALKPIFGPIRPGSTRMYAYGVGEVPLLTRSPAALRALIHAAFDLAEREDVPVEFHVDPLYGFGADTEASPKAAPAVKFWDDPQMREWAEFPVGTQPPAHIPAEWFNWGSWVSPAPAVPAIGSPRFLQFAVAQMRDGVAGPIAERVRRLNRAGKGYLFAGVNVGWETHIFKYDGINPHALPVAVWPVERRGVTMRPWEVGAQLGYASLYWQGWTEAKLAAEARRRGLGRDALFNDLCWHATHDYMQALARACHDKGLPRDRVYTHIVAMASVNPAWESTTVPPIWVAVNPDSTPGFTMDNKGAAVYDLAAIQRQVRAADPTQAHFAASESYLNDYRDEAALTALLRQTFGGGAVIKCLYGAFPPGRLPFGIDPKPENDTLAIQRWLQGG